MKPNAVCSVTPKIAHQASWIGLKKSNGEARKMACTPSGHRVVAATRERVAACDASGSHPPALQPSVPLDGLIRVVRAGRVVATRGRQDFRERPLITADQEQEQL